MKKIILLILGTVLFGNVVAQQTTANKAKQVPMVAPVAVDNKSIVQKDLKKVVPTPLVNNKKSVENNPPLKSGMVIISQPKNNMVNGAFDQSKLIPKPLDIKTKKLTGNDTLDEYNSKREVFLRKKAEVKKLMDKRIKEEVRKRNALILQEIEQEKKWKEFEARNPKTNITREKMMMMEASRGKAMPTLPPLGNVK